MQNPPVLTGPAWREGGFVLASASQARRAMLANVGLPVLAEAAHVDEDEIKQSHKAEGADVADTAMALAALKAGRISPRHPDAMVLGADQMLVLDGVWFDKPVGLDGAREQLLRLAGKTHELVSAACIFRNGERIWHGIDRALLTMRPLDDAFLDAYLAAVGEKACSSVGGYQLEGPGAQLFSRIDGDFFTILGLPLLQLLDYLRIHRILP